MTAPRTLADALRDARARIDAVDAEWLLLHALGQHAHGQRASEAPDRAWLFAHAHDALPAQVATRFDALVAARERGEPVAYLTGRRGFWTLDLDVTPDVLVPRPETERLVELALERLPASDALRIADLGTGSGAIALALARERPRARVWAVDASAGALAVARANAQRLGIGNVVFALGDWWAPLAGQRFDLVAGNPPYIALDDPHLAQGDLRYEPAMALSSGNDGLDAIREIVRDAQAHLAPGGWLLLEHGWTQGAEVRALFDAAGLVETATAQDLEARDRVTLGRSL